MAAKKQRATKRKRKARRKSAGSRARRRPETGFRLDDDEVERCLLSGESSSLLEEYFGEANYQELVSLARQASTRSTRGGARVLLLPGIMGSKLGKKAWLFHDIVWIDPFDIALGNLKKLALPKGKSFKAVGVMLFAYLKMKLRLRLAGFDVDFHPYDWRQSIDSLGKELAERFEDDRAKKIHVVAHSMGGLVTRSAVAQGAGKKLGRFVMLGTPNRGSFAPVQALRGTYGIVTTLSKLDLANSPIDWAEDVLRTFPGLYQMLPTPEVFSGVNLYDAKEWPGSTRVPDPKILGKVRSVQKKLAKPDKRFFLIAGVDLPTSVGVEKSDSGFVYKESREGDGVVPLAFAKMPNLETYYVKEVHGSLPNNGAVARAVIDLLRKGETRALPKSWDRSRASKTRTVTEAELQTDAFEGRSVQQLAQRDRRELLSVFASPEASGEPASGSGAVGASAAAAAAPSKLSADGVIVSRRKQHSIELRIARGSITEADARSLVLGIFREVEPAGAAQAVDELLDGAIKEFTARRMFSAEIGDVFVMPTGRSHVYADSVTFTGLGNIDTFNSDVLEFAAENVVRTFIRTHVEDFATVLIGGGTGRSVTDALTPQLRGYVRGILDADTDHRMRRITICEIDPQRHAQIRDAAYALARTPLFDDVTVTLDETELPVATRGTARRPRSRVTADARIAYLFVSRDERDDARPRRGSLKVRGTSKLILRSSILTAGSKATVLTGTKDVDQKKLTALLDELEDRVTTGARLESFGRRLAEMTLHDDVRAALGKMRKYHIAVVHDATASRMPWETICVDKWFPAAGKGLSRRYAAENLSVAKWLDSRRVGQRLDVLLVVNPTLDLRGADAEAEQLKRIFAENGSIRVTEVRHGDATKRRLLEEFSSGKYDVLHYAGHAFFDPDDPSRSGIICHGDHVLAGRNLANLSNLPALVFFNACEAARLRKRGEKRKAVRERIDRNVGLAETFLLGGVANYVGTYWPVSDAAAEKFASKFYASLVQGETIGRSLTLGRLAAKQRDPVDWADYVHYGSYEFVLKGLGE